MAETQEVAGSQELLSSRIWSSLCPFGPWGSSTTVRSGPWWSQVALLSSSSYLDCAASILAMPTGVTAQRGPPPTCAGPQHKLQEASLGAMAASRGSPVMMGGVRGTFPFKHKQKVFWPEHHTTGLELRTASLLNSPWKD